MALKRSDFDSLDTNILRMIAFELFRNCSYLWSHETEFTYRMRRSSVFHFGQVSKICRFVTLPIVWKKIFLEDVQPQSSECQRILEAILDKTYTPTQYIKHLVVKANDFGEAISTEVWDNIFESIDDLKYIT